ncbi:MAG: LamG-like jellyroll fold domain-containing protein [Sulfuricaulis sp.]|nr:LamG-like jellyroll fold domain-containing protein [Sulfuricaulis sp.]
MTLPNEKVEVALASNPTDANPVWTDITSYVRSLSTTRGRKHELQRSEAGQMQAAIDNRDRRFDPEHAAGPHYGNLLPLRRIRWQAARYEKLLISDTPAGYWRLGEASGAVATDESGNANHGAITGTGITMAATGLLGCDPDTCYDLDSAGTFAIDCGNGASLRFTSDVWLEAIVNPDVIQQQGICGRWAAGNLSYLLAMNADGSLLFRISDDGAAIYDLQTAAGVCTAGNTYHIIAYKSGTSGRINVNGTLSVLDLTAFPAAVYAGAANFYIGAWGNYGLRLDGKIDEVFVKGAVPTSAQIPDHNAERQGRKMFTGFVYGWPQSWPGRNDAVVPIVAHDGLAMLAQSKVSASYAQERSDVRMVNVLDDVQWPGAGLSNGDHRDLDTGRTTVQASTLTNEQALDHLYTVNDSENGAIFVNGEGKYVFQERWSRLLAYSSALVTFGDGGGAELPYVDLVLSYDVSEIRNDIRITRVGGAEQTATNAASQASYFPRSHVKTGLLMTTDLEVADAANYLLARYKDPATRVRSITVIPADNETVWYWILKLEIGDKITVARRPPGGGSAISKDVFIEHVAHQRVGKLWTTTYQLSPADIQSYWILGDVAYGLLGQTTRLGY